MTNKKWRNEMNYEDMWEKLKKEVDVLYLKIKNTLESYWMGKRDGYELIKNEMERMENEMKKEKIKLFLNLYEQFSKLCSSYLEKNYKENGYEYMGFKVFDGEYVTIEYAKDMKINMIGVKIEEILCKNVENFWFG